MNGVLWVIAILLATVSAGSGATKLALSKQRLSTLPRMEWTESFPPVAIKAIGVLELLAAAGLTLPPLAGVGTVLVPAAAVGLALLMAGAAATHVRRHEPQGVVVTLTIVALCAIEAWGRLVPYPF